MYTTKDVIRITRIHKIDLENQANLAPTIRDFLRYGDERSLFDGDLPDEEDNEYYGYACLYEVTYKDLTAEEALERAQFYNGADEFEYKKQGNGLFSMRLWWD